MQAHHRLVEHRSGDESHPLAIGYVTNGFLCHRLEDAIDILAAAGYDGIALSLDVHHANPFEWQEADYRRLRKRLEDRGLRVCIETGARYLLNPNEKHQPTLISRSGREERIAFLERAVKVAVWLSADVVTFFAGQPDASVSPDQAWEWLIAGCRRLCDFAEARGILLSLEPEPGMLVETIAEYQRLRVRVGSRALVLTADINHLHCSEPDSVSEALDRGAPHLRNVHISDAAANRVHKHLPPGEGAIDFVDALAALARQRYGGLVNLELSGHSSEAPPAARAALAHLRARMPAAADFGGVAS